MRRRLEQAAGFELEDTGKGVDLVVTGAWTGAAEAALRSGRADGLVLNYARGFQERNLELLRGLPIRRLDILARTLTDLSPIYAVASTLSELSVQSDPRAALDLERLPHLKSLSATWSQITLSVRSAPAIERLFLLHYDERDFTSIAHLNSLRTVRMKDSPRVSTLEGVEALPWLANLGVFGASELADISALSLLASPILRTLELASCRQIPDLAPVASCLALDYLNAANCGDFPSASPLGELRQLESLYLYESTRFADGDLSAIAGLPRLRDLRMMSRRHYQPSVDSIKARITSQG